MSKANWADEDESDEDVSPEEVLQDQLLNQVEKSRGAAPKKENRDRSGSNVSSGSQGDRSRRRGHYDQPGGGSGGPRQEGRGGYRNDRSGGGHDGGNRGYGDAPPTEVPRNGPYIAYVGNLSYNSSAQTVGEYFQDGGCQVEDCKILTDRDGRPRGYANVTFSDRKSLVDAMQADNTELDGRNISVRVDRRSGTDRKKSYERAGSDRGSDRDPAGAGVEEEGSWSRGARKDGPGPRNRERKERLPASGETSGERPTRGGGDEAAAPAPPKTRPALKLAPRTVPLDATPAAETSRPSSIFGEAKPVDVKEKPDPAPKAIKPKDKEKKSENKEKKNGNVAGNEEVPSEWGRGTDAGKKGGTGKDFPKKKDKESKVSANC